MLLSVALRRAGCASLDTGTPFELTYAEIELATTRPVKLLRCNGFITSDLKVKEVEDASCMRARSAAVCAAIDLGPSDRHM